MKDADVFRNLTIAEARAIINEHPDQAAEIITNLPLHTVTRQRLRKEYKVPTPSRKGQLQEGSKIGYIRRRLGALPQDERVQIIRNAGLHHMERDRLREFFGLKRNRQQK